MNRTPSRRLLPPPAPTDRGVALRTFLSADDSFSRRAVRQQPARLVQREQAPLRGVCSRYCAALHTVHAEAAGAHRAEVRGCADARRRVVDAGLSRHAICERQDAVQDQHRHPVPARTGQRRALAGLLPAYRTVAGVHRRRHVAARAGCAARDSRAHRRASGRLAPGGRWRPLSTPLRIGRRITAASAARFRS